MTEFAKVPEPDGGIVLDDSSEVSRLLVASLRAHNQARGARKARQKEEALKCVREAYELRMKAHALDPDHDDPAWGDEQHVTIPEWDTHQKMMEFYRQQLNVKAE